MDDGFFHHLRPYAYPEVMSMDEEKVILQDLPTSVRGFCYHDDDGEEFVILNSRLTREQNMTTYDHERKHLIRGDMYESNYNEYGGEKK
jgi:hypothetical protein